MKIILTQSETVPSAPLPGNNKNFTTEPTEITENVEASENLRVLNILCDLCGLCGKKSDLLFREVTVA